MRREPAAAHACAQHRRPPSTSSVTAGSERFLGAVGQREEHPLTISVSVEPRRPRHDGRVLDVDVREAPLVEAQHDAPVGLGVEPAEERAAQALVLHLRALVDEAPLAVDADARAAKPLERLRVDGHC